MADLSFTQGADPVEITNSSSGNIMSVNADGSTDKNLTKVAGSAISLGQKTMANSLPITIASDQSSLSIAIGLPTYLDKTFGFSAGINQPIAGLDNPLIYLKNPSGSGKIIYLKFVSYGIAIANVLGTIRLYKNPTVTSDGTSETIVAFGSSSTAMQIYTVPTVTSNGTLINTSVTGQNNNSVIQDFAYEIQIPANSTLLITGNPGSNNRQAEIAVRWIEL